jgi:DNA-binding NtrC family response regulator
MARLLAHDWGGNLRELNHTLRTMTLLCDGDPREPMIKQIDRVIGDLVRQAEQFKSTGGNPICVGLVDVNFCIPLHWIRRSSRVADRCQKTKHPIQEAEDVG